MGRHQVQVHAVIKNFLGLCSSRLADRHGRCRGPCRGMNEEDALYNAPVEAPFFTAPPLQGRVVQVALPLIHK